MLTYYQAIAAGDADAAKQAVTGDEMATRYLEAVATYAGGLKDLEASLSSKFGQEAVSGNEAFVKTVARYQPSLAVEAITAAEVRMSGDIAIVTPKLRSGAMVPDATGPSPVHPMPGVLRQMDGKWRLLIGAMRRRDVRPAGQPGRRRHRDHAEVRAVDARIGEGNPRRPLSVGRRSLDHRRDESPARSRRQIGQGAGRPCHRLADARLADTRSRDQCPPANAGATGHECRGRPAQYQHIRATRYDPAAEGGRGERRSDRGQSAGRPCDESSRPCSGSQSTEGRRSAA